MVQTVFKENYDEKFIDETLPYEKSFPREVQLDGHRFSLICKGWYRADPVFTLERKAFKEYIKRWEGITFCVAIKREGAQVTSPSELDDDFEYYQERDNDRIEIYAAISNSSGEKNENSHLYQLLRDLKEAGELSEVEITLSELLERRRLDIFSESYWENGSDGICENPMDYEYVPDKEHWIKFGNTGAIFYRLEEGIYHLPEEYRLQVDMNNPVSSGDERVAGICQSTDFHPTPYVSVRYLAVGEKYFARLREICENLDEDYFYHEFRNQSTNMHWEPLTLDKILEWSSELNDLVEQEEVPVVSIPEAAKPLIPGCGFENVKVTWRVALDSEEKSADCNAAWMIEDELHLIENGEQTVIDLRILEFLSVVYHVKMNAGFECPISRRLIDCHEEKLKQMLTEEAKHLLGIE